MIFTVNNSRVKDIEKEALSKKNQLEISKYEKIWWFFCLETNKKNDKKVGEISKPDDTRDEG